jgi:hypothetical protein
MNYQKTIAQLNAKIRALSARLDQRPVIQTMTPAVISYLCYVTGGNSLTNSSLSGIKHSSSEIASVPSAYDPNVDTTFIDGIGRGILAINGVTQSGYVLIVNDTRGTLPVALANGHTFYSGGPVYIPISGSSPAASVTAYTTG